MRYLVSVLFCLSIFACSDNCTDAMETFTWQTGLVVALDFNEELQVNTLQFNPGDLWLFDYSRTGAQCDDITDDESTQQLVFSIDPSLDSFEFSDVELSEINCYFRHVAFFISPPQAVTHGTIRGTKKSDTKWDIDVDVVISATTDFEETRTIQFSEHFELIN